MPTIVAHPEPSGKTPRASLRERWRREVMRTSLIGDATKLLLLAMHDDMDSKGYVSLLRPELADRIGRSERRVTERLTEAVEARFLDRVRRGQKGVTPVYRAMLPTSLSETIHSPLNVQRDDPQPAEKSPDRPAETTFSGTHGGPTSSKAPGQEAAALTPEPGQFTSELLSENDEVQDDPAETAAAKALLRRAHESWGIPIPAHLRESA